MKHFPLRTKPFCACGEEGRKQSFARISTLINSRSSLMSEQIKVDDIAESWRSGHQRRMADLGVWLRDYLERRRLRALDADAFYSGVKPALIKKAPSNSFHPTHSRTEIRNSK
jgi:hypothetical protein